MPWFRDRQTRFVLARLAVCLGSWCVPLASPVRAADSNVAAEAELPAFTFPLPQLTLKEISATKRDIRQHLVKKIGRISEVTVPTGKPANFYACIGEYASARGDAKKLTAMVARHLAMVDKLLVQEDVEVRRSGLFLANEVARCASETLKDHDLTLAIVESYLLPNFELAYVEHWNHLSRETLAKNVTSYYFSAKKYDKMADAARVWIRIAPNRNSADAGRSRLSWAFDLQGKTADAIAVLREISDETGMRGAKRFIPDLEKKLAEQTAKQKAKPSP